MISRLFSIYRASPFWLRNLLARFTWPIRLVMLPFSTIRLDGYRMVLDFMDNASFKYYADRERYEAAEVSAFLSAVIHNPGACVIDVGASYGAFTLAAAHLNRHDLAKTIIALEPDKRAFAALEKSIRRNGFDRCVNAYRAIAGDRAGRQTLFVNARSSADNRSHQVTTSPIRVRRSYQVPCVTLDSLAQGLGLEPHCRFIVKIDVQGNEFRVLKGMAKTLADAPGFVIFFEHCPRLIESAGIDAVAYERLLEDLGADAIFEIDDDVTRLDGFDGLRESFRRLESSRETKMEAGAANYVLVKNMTFVGKEDGGPRPAAVGPRGVTTPVAG